MVRIGTSFAVLALSIAAACQSPTQASATREEVMAASGFKRVPATTPQQQAALRQLPPHKFTRQTHDGHVTYIYADPTGCVCLYVGDHNAHVAYKNAMLDRKLADEQALADNETEMNDIDWGPWGPSPLGTW
jgi:hypothetical protein